jgi:hypothetical protein
MNQGGLPRRATIALSMPSIASPGGPRRQESTGRTNRLPTSWLTAPWRVTSGRGQQRARSARNGRELVHTRPIPGPARPGYRDNAHACVANCARISLSTIGKMPIMAS